MISSYFDDEITATLYTVASRNDRGTPTYNEIPIRGRITYSKAWIKTMQGTEEQADAGGGEPKAVFLTDVRECPMSSILWIDSVEYKIVNKKIMKDFMNSHMELYLK